jgi:hypothetical protein
MKRANYIYQSIFQDGYKELLFVGENTADNRS